jgi:hypothetical protein
VIPTCRIALPCPSCQACPSCPPCPGWPAVPPARLAHLSARRLPALPRLPALTCCPSWRRSRKCRSMGANESRSCASDPGNQGSDAQDLGGGVRGHALRLVHRAATGCGVGVEVSDPGGGRGHAAWRCAGPGTSCGWCARGHALRVVGWGAWAWVAGGGARGHALRVVGWGAWAWVAGGGARRSAIPSCAVWACVAGSGHGGRRSRWCSARVDGLRSLRAHLSPMIVYAGVRTERRVIAVGGRSGGDGAAARAGSWSCTYGWEAALGCGAWRRPALRRGDGGWFAGRGGECEQHSAAVIPTPSCVLCGVGDGGGQAVRDQGDLPVAGAEAAERVGDRLRGHLVGW